MAIKHIRRIPMRQFEYHELHGDETTTFEEIDIAAETVRKYFENKGVLHKPTPPPLDPSFSPGLAMPQERVCASCGTAMTFKQGVSKKNGKPWKGWFCPNSSEADNHPPVWVK